MAICPIIIHLENEYTKHHVFELRRTDAFICNLHLLRVYYELTM